MFIQYLFDRLKNEPALVITSLFVIVFTAYKVFGPDKMPVDQVFTEDYATYLGAVVAGVLTRLNVFTPATVEKVTEAALADAAADRTEVWNFEDEEV